jgi:hypothetical protein
MEAPETGLPHFTEGPFLLQTHLLSLLLNFSMNRILFLLLFTITAGLISCDKDDDPATPVTYEPGLGGMGEISLYVRHNDTLVPGARVYIKFGADSFPGTDTTLYDLSKICGTTGHGLGHSHIDELHAGAYYIFVTAFDSVNAVTLSGDKGARLESEDDHEELIIHLD